MSKQKRRESIRRIRLVPHPDPEKAKQGEKVKALSLDFNVVEEHWNIYELEDGSRVRARVCVSGAARSLDRDTEEPLFKDSGEPIFGIDMSVEVRFEPAESSLKKEA